MHPLVEDPRRRVVSNQQLHPLRPIPGLFSQFAVRGDRRVLTRFQRAGRQFDERSTDRRAVVFDQADSPIVKDRQQDGGPGMPDNFPHVFGPVGRRLNDPFDAETFSLE